MTVEEFKDEVIRRLEEQANYAEDKAKNNKSWFRRWDGIHRGTLKSMDIIEDIYNDNDE